MPKPLIRVLAALVLLSGLLAPGGLVAAEHRLGVGLHYWSALDDLVEEVPGIEDAGVSWLGSYIFDVEGPLKFGLDLEYFPDGFGGSMSSAWAPQAFALVGGKLYAGVGVGVTLASSFDSNHSDPYFLARLGFDFPIFPRLSLDLNLNYQSDAFNELDNVDSSAITTGVIVRYRIKSRD